MAVGQLECLVARLDCADFRVLNIVIRVVTFTSETTNQNDAMSAGVRTTVASPTRQVSVF